MRYLAFPVFILGVSCSAPSEDDIQAEFDAFVAHNNSCMVDDDCALATADCPLGCFVAVNESRVDETEAKARALIDDYESGGRKCFYQCATPGPLRCEAQHCVVEAAPPSDGCTQIGCASAFQIT